MNRYDGVQKSVNRSIQQIDERLWFPKEGQNKLWVLPTVESGGKSFFNDFYVHKILDDVTGRINWVACLRLTKGQKCPFCEKFFELIRTKIPADLDFAKNHLEAKTKYLLNVVPYDEQKTKIYVTDPRIMGWIPGKDKKIYTNDKLIYIFLAIDQESYEKGGKEVFLCPNIIDRKEGTYITIHRDPSGKFDQYTVMVPPEALRKPLEDYDKRLGERHNLVAYHDEIVGTLTYDELHQQLNILLNKGTTPMTTTTEVGSDKSEDSVSDTEEVGDIPPDIIPPDEDAEQHVVYKEGYKQDVTPPVDKEPEVEENTVPPPKCHGTSFEEDDKACSICDDKTTCKDIVVNKILEKG